MLKQYAQYFVAFLLNNLNKPENITRIILYGSVARGEATNKSDIDIFLELKKRTKRIEEDIRNAENKFYLSREASLFKVKSISNKFSIKMGDLREWKDLYTSIASTGIVLYGPYEARELPSGVKHSIIYYWDSIGKNRGAFLNKLYGVKIKNKSYPGILAKFGGQRMGKSCIIIPIEHRSEVEKLIKAHKVSAKVHEVFTA